MKRLFLTFLLVLGLASPAFPINKVFDIISYPATTLDDAEGTLAPGGFKTPSARTYIHGGILYTADGDDTPFSHTSIEDEASYTSMRGSFVDGQAWWDGEIVTNLDTSDFSAGVDNYTGTRLHTFTGNHDAVSDGTISKDNCFMLAANANNASHHTYIVKADNGMAAQADFKITYSFYVPAAQTHADGFLISYWNGSSETTLVTHDGVNGTWTTNSIYVSVAETATMTLNFKMTDGGVVAFIGDNDGVGDLLYLKDIVIDSYVSLATQYDGTGNLVKIYDGAGAEYGYGFLGDKATGLTESAEKMPNQVDRDFNAASAWSDVDLAAYDEAGDLTITSNAIDQYCTCPVASVPTTAGKEYNLDFTVLNIVSTWTIKSFDGTHTIGTVTANGYQTFRFTAETTGGLRIVAVANNSSGDFDDFSLKEITEPDASAIHIYKEYGLLNEGWNSIDTGYRYNAGPDHDFDVYTNLMTSTGSTAQVRFEDGWLCHDPEGINWLLGTQWNTGNGTDVTVANDDGYLRHDGATNDFAYIEGDGGADVAFSVDAESMHNDSTARSLKIVITNDGDSADDVSVSNATGLSVVNAEVYTLSFWIKTTTTEASIPITYENGVNDTFATVANTWTLVEEDFIATATVNNENFVIQLGNIGEFTAYIECMQFEHSKFRTSWIPTELIPVVRTTEASDASDNGYSWTIVQAVKNVLDDAEPVASPTDSQGTLLFDILWGCDESDIAVNGGIIATSDNMYRIAYFSITAFESNDGVNNTSINHPAFSAGDIITYASRWGDVDGAVDDLSAGFREAEGAWSFDGTPGAYDGEFTLGTKIRIGYGCLYPFKIRNIELWDGLATQFHPVMKPLIRDLIQPLLDPEINLIR